ncbi:MAG: GDP-mannose 4,6-dehydratase [Desulfobacterales bacterium]|nr:GDP-mannose 4,6-dehydratase [Desulfobacterales bacterium]
MRVLVTGGSGFIGGRLIPKLVECGHEVYSLERYVTGRYVLGAKAMTVFGDLRDSFTIRKLVREVQPDSVIHLASISPVSFSYDHPQEVFEVNTLGTINLAESCLREVPNFRQFLMAGTSEEYGNQTEIPIKEDAELRPNSPYAVSKVAADKYLQYMCEAYDFPATVLRPFNTYGREDNTHFVVERTITQMLQGKKIKLGDPQPVRDFMYVDDHANAYLACLGNKKVIGDIFNFCTGYGVSIKELIGQIAKLVGFDGEIIWGTIPTRPLDIKKLVGNCEKAKHVLGWKPKYTLEGGLRKTVDFWKHKLNMGDEEAAR